MIKTLSYGFVAAGLLQFGLLLSAQDKTDKRDLLATEAAKQFIEALEKKDIEAVMKTVDVPFFFGGRGRRFEVKTREQLQLQLADELPPAPRKMDSKVRGVYSFGALPEGFFSSDDQKLLGGILEKTDRIVLLDLPQRIIAIAARVRNGKPTVVGIHAPVHPLTLFAAARDKEKGDKNAQAAREVVKHTVERFLKAATAKDLDSLVKLSDVPWYADGTDIIKERDKLKQLLKSDWIEFAGHARFPTQVLAIARFGDLDLKPGKGRLPPDGVLAKDDWAAWLGREARVVYLVFVRVVQGKGKFVGATSASS